MNIPNKLSVARICMVPLFIAMFLIPVQWGVFAAVAIFILATLTDFLDGYIARKYNMVTDLGKLLDPIADKVLVCAALFCITAANPFQYLGENAAFWFSQDFTMMFLICSGTLILSRELLISAMRMIAAAKGIVVQANKLGKIKTIFQDVSLPFILVLYAQKYNPETHIAYDVIGIVGLILLGVAVLLTVISGVVYMVQNKRVFAEKND